MSRRTKRSSNLVEEAVKKDEEEFLKAKQRALEFKKTLEIEKAQSNKKRLSSEIPKLKSPPTKKSPSTKKRSASPKVSIDSYLNDTIEEAINSIDEKSGSKIRTSPSKVLSPIERSLKQYEQEICDKNLEKPVPTPPTAIKKRSTRSNLATPDSITVPDKDLSTESFNKTKLSDSKKKVIISDQKLHSDDFKLDDYNNLSRTQIDNNKTPTIFKFDGLMKFGSFINENLLVKFNQSINDPKYMEIYLNRSFLSICVLFFGFAYYKTRKFLGPSLANFLILLMVPISILAYLHRYYESYLPDFYKTRVKKVTSFTRDLINKFQQYLYEFLIFTAGIFMLISIITMYFNSLLTKKDSKVESSFSISSIFDLFSSLIWILSTSFLVSIIYYVSNWQYSMKKQKNTEIMYYAERAKNFLLACRSDDGIPSEYFIEDFLDNQGVKNPEKRQSIKKMWPEIEAALLDDKRVRKTGTQKLSGGGSDYKYKFNHTNLNLYSRHTQSSSAFGRSAVPQSSSQLYSPMTNALVSPIGKKTLHQPGDKVVITGLSSSTHNYVSSGVKQSEKIKPLGINQGKENKKSFLSAFGW